MRTNHLYRSIHLFLSLFLGLALSLSCQTQKPEEVVGMSFGAFREGDIVTFSNYVDYDSEFGKIFNLSFENLEKQYGLKSLQNLWKVLYDDDDDMDYLYGHMEIKEVKIINRDSSVVIIHYPDVESDLFGHFFSDNEVSLRRVRGSWKISDPGITLSLIIALCGSDGLDEEDFKRALD